MLYHSSSTYQIKKCIAIVAFIIVQLLLPASHVFTEQKDNAINAIEQGNYALALNLWTKLAQQGDSIAQYNLGIFYSQGLGIKPNNYEAERWFRVASKSGLVQAYNKLKTKGIKPSGLITIQTVLTPQQWVTQLEPSDYTLQLASSKNKKLIEKYYKDNNLQNKAGYYSSLRQGERWYALVFGAYDTVSDAKAAFKDIPSDLRKWSPWVRKIKDIHKITVY